MPDLNIRNIDQSLLRDINIAAAKAEVTQRDYVIQALTKCVGWEKEHGKPEKSEQPQPIERAQTDSADSGGVESPIETERVSGFAREHKSRCKIYGCGICRVLEIEDKKRGL
jgi:hypothetical protein